MSYDVANIQSGNFAALASAMGMGEVAPKQKQSNLARLRIESNPVMGMVEVKGKQKKMEVIEGGSFRLELPNGDYVFSDQVSLRIFMQRFMYKRWDNNGREFIKTLMANDMKGDLKDNKGGFNCGRPSGYVEDWQALPEATRELILSCKRTRVIMGQVTLLNPLDASGEVVEDVPDNMAFIWEDNTKAGFPAFNPVFQQFLREKLLPLQREVLVDTEGKELPNGNMTYWPVPKIVDGKEVSISDEDQKTFQDFVDWIDNYNDYIIKEWNEAKASKVEGAEADLTEEFIDVSSEIDIEDSE